MSVAVEGASVLVTGASSGIGRALAVLLAERGARAVGVTGRRGDELDQVADECRGHGADAESWTLDLADTDAAERLAIDAWDRFDGLDVLVNNAGTPKRRHVTEISLDEVRHTMAVNFEAPVRMGLAVLPRMLERGRGSVVNVSSFGGRAGIIDETAYCASKFALCGWSESMALDLWDDPVDVRLILPGAIDTDIWDRPGSDDAVYDGPLEPPATVAEGIVDAIEGDSFELYVPDMKAIAEFKTSDVDGFLAGAAAFAAERRAEES